MIELLISLTALGRFCIQIHVYRYCISSKLARRDFSLFMTFSDAYTCSYGFSSNIYCNNYISFYCTPATGPIQS